ncbi:hypothetical protein IFM89_034368 [Coptis chinensis]|uniref:RNA-directed DNA polymerase, eukaryota, reverse transcriptase zinc-binding domain protein n=1 Tax=Coptis chinensis TaxID=261450 RepID=A0A835LH94_9MAGN|nr:hypothetical protein IFM89_034368 [Coptis chinensis]
MYQLLVEEGNDVEDDISEGEAEIFGDQIQKTSISNTTDATLKPTQPPKSKNNKKNSPPIAHYKKKNIKSPWCALGDFNNALYSFERIGCEPVHPKGTEPFVACLASTGLYDIKVIGPSNHSLILLSILDAERSKPPIRYCNSWYLHPEFEPILLSCWSTPLQGNPSFILSKKLKILKGSLKGWAKVHFSDFKRKKEAIRTELNLVQLQLQNKSLDPTLCALETRARAQLSLLIEMEAMDLAQKIDCDWMLMGDRCNEYFYNSIKEKKKGRSSTWQITNDQENRIEGQQLASEAFIRFYIELLGSPSTAYCTTDLIEGIEVRNVIDYVTADEITKEISGVKIRNVMFSIEDNRAPGVDGFNAFFYKKYWAIVGADVIKAVKFMFTTKHIHKGTNSTILCLIPKKPNASKVGEFRPIPCCTTLGGLEIRVLRLNYSTG